MAFVRIDLQVLATSRSCEGSLDGSCSLKRRAFYGGDSVYRSSLMHDTDRVDVKSPTDHGVVIEALRLLAAPHTLVARISTELNRRAVADIDDDHSVLRLAQDGLSVVAAGGASSSVAARE
jgi:hypothetical protein